MAKKVEIEVVAKTDKANVKIKKTTETTKGLGKEAGAVGGKFNSMTGGIIAGFKGALISIKATIKSMGILKLAIIATGIGALALGILAIGKAFTNSEEGQNKFRIIMIQIGTVVGNVVDILADLGNMYLSVGKTLAKLITGDFKGAKEAFKEIGENAAAAATKVKNFGEETAREIKVATSLQKARNKLDKIERDLLIERAKANRDIAAAREIAAAKLGVSLEERMAAIKDAARIEDAITKKEIAAAKMRLQARVDENSLAGSTKEDLLEEARLRAEVITLETSALKIKKALTAELTAQTREADTEKRAAQTIIDNEKKERDAVELTRLKELATAELALREALAVTKAEKDALEIEKTNMIS